MRFRLAILLFFVAIVSTGCVSGSKETIQEAGPSTIAVVSTLNDTGKNEISTEIVTIDEPVEFITLFDQYLTQAKVHYVDALLAQDDEDSLEVEFQLSIIFDLLAKIESYNGMDGIQYEQFKEFTDRIIKEFEEYAPQMSELHEQFSLSDLKEAMGTLTDEHFAGNGNKDIVVLEDRDGHIPIMINNRVETSIKMFTSKRRGDMQNWIKTKATYERLFRKILRENGVPEEFIYLSMLESEMKTDARSYVGAMGQWQFMDYTGKSFGLKYDYWVDERRDPVKATIAAAKYMLYLYEEFNDWYLVMAAYNAGEGRLARSIRYEHTRDYWKMKTLP
ncbi:MAG: lytic transglycosylase domain-containing protein, partial [Candidatus Marinimicrobia bacterium]|nr:lytic transglycosylase domain-containing protein [Candidatus Neomarinimicrobiota bacterium]